MSVLTRVVRLAMKTAFAVLLAFVASAALAAPRSYSIAADGKNAATFAMNDPFEQVDGVTKKLTGTIVGDPANVAGATVEVSVELAAIDTGSKLRDSHIRDEFAETQKFPRAVFKSVSVSGAATLAPNQPTDINVTGDFSMHGVTHRITIPVRVVLIPESEITKAQRGAGDWLHATAKFRLKLSDYGIHVPKSFVDDELAMTVDVFGVAR